MSCRDFLVDVSPLAEPWSFPEPGQVSWGTWESRFQFALSRTSHPEEWHHSSDQLAHSRPRLWIMVNKEKKVELTWSLSCFGPENCSCLLGSLEESGCHEILRRKDDVIWDRGWSRSRSDPFLSCSFGLLFSTFFSYLFLGTPLAFKPLFRSMDR